MFFDCCTLLGCFVYCNENHTFPVLHGRRSFVKGLAEATWELAANLSFVEASAYHAIIELYALGQRDGPIIHLHHSLWINIYHPRPIQHTEDQREGYTPVTLLARFELGSNQIRHLLGN
jgi:hypothetical protein